MKKKSHISLYIIILLTMGVLISTAAMAQITSTVAGGAWATGTTWVGGVPPTAAQAAIIVGPVTVGATITQTASVTINSGGTLTATTAGTTVTVAGLTIMGGGTFTCSRILTVNGPTAITGTINLQTAARANAFNGDVTLNNGAVWNETIANTPTITGNWTNNATTFTASTGVYTFSGTGMTFSGATTTSIPRVAITGMYTNNGTLTVGTALTGAGTLTNDATGVLNIGGTSTITTLTATTVGNTVNYNGGAAQPACKVTIYHNLTISGAGAKTFATTPTVNGVLSLEGTANIAATAGVVTYGPNATLQYNKPAAYTATTEEWITPFVATGGIIITNTGAITTPGAVQIGNNTSVPLNINGGATLTPGANLLTFHGDFINAGTLTIGTGGVTIAGSGATQNISGFTTTGNVSMTKTAGTATISGAVSAVNLTVNGAGSTLVLSGSNTFSGTRTLTAGTLSLTNIAGLGAAGTALALNGGTLDLNTDASVNAYNVTVGGGATISSDRATSGAGITHTLGTLSIGAFTLGVTAGSNVTSGTAGVTFGNSTLTANTPVFDVAAGANLTLGAVGGAFGMTKQGAGQMTLATTSTRVTAAGTTTLTAGTLRLNIANALNTLATAPLALNGGTLSLGVTAGATYGGTATTVGGAATIESDLLTPGAGATQTLGTLSIGAFTLGVTAGSNVTSGTAGVTFGAVTHTGAPTYTVTNPAGGGVTQLSLGAVGNANFLTTFNGNGNVIQTGAFGNGSGGVTYSGTGTLTLNQANTYTGPTTISSGTIRLGAANSIPNTSALIVNGTFDMAGFAETVGSLAGSASGIVTNSAAGAITLTAGNDNTSTTYSGIIQNGSGIIALTKAGTGTLMLSGNNSYTGLTSIGVGILQLGAAGDGTNTPLGTITGGTTVSATGAALDLNGFTLSTAEPLTLNGTGIALGGALTNSSATAISYSGSIVLGSTGVSIITNAGDINITNAGTLTGATFGLTLGGTGNGSVTSVIGTTSGTVTKIGTGNWTLSGTNTYTGLTTLTAGTLSLANISALGAAGNALALNGGTLDLMTDASVNAYNVTVGGGATISSDRATSGAGITHTLGTLSIGAFTLGVTAGSNVTSGTAGVTFGTTTLTAAAIFNVSSNNANLTLGAVGGAFGMTKQGAGQMTLATTSTRVTAAGTTTLTAGTLRLNIANALNTLATAPLALNGGTLSLGVTAGATYGGTATTVGGAATIESDLLTPGAGATQTLGTLSIGAFTLGVTAGSNVTSGTAGVTFGTTTLTAAAIFNVSSNNANLTLGAVGGAFGMTKQGAGQMTLATTSTRVTAAGTTTLTAGTLRLNIANALNTLATAPLALNGGTLSLGVTAGATYGGTATTIGGAATVESDLLTPGAGVTQTLGTLSIGAFTLGVTAGSNVTSGTAGVTFGTTTLTAAAIFNVSSNNANLTLGAVGGAFGMTKQGAGQMTLATTSTRVTAAGTTTLTAGTLRLNIANALNTLATAPLALNGGTLSLGVTAGATYGGTATTVGGAATIESDRLTPGAGATQTLGTLSIGAFTLGVTAGSNVTSGTAGVTFGAVTHTGAPTYTVTNPAGGGVTQLSLGAVGNANFLTTFNGNGNVIQTGAFGNGSGGVTYSGTGTLTLNQANTFTGGTTLNSGTLNINNASALGTIAGTFSIAGGSINASGGAINTVNYPIALIGDFTFTGSNALNLGTGAVTMNNNCQVTVSANTLTIGGVLSGASYNLTKAGTGILNLGTNAVTLNGLTINAGMLTASSGTTNVAGNFSNSGTFIANNGTVNFNGGAAQTIGGTSASTFNNLVINNANGVSLSAPASLSNIGTLTLTSGILTSSGTNLLTITNTAGGSIAGASATSYIDGALAMTLPSNIATDGTTYLYPVGENGNYRPLELVNIRTGATSPVVRVTLNGTGASTCDETTITSIAPRNWNIQLTSGNFTSAFVRLTESGLLQTRVIGTSSAQSGNYVSIGGANIGASITSAQIVLGTSLPTYFAIGTSLIQGLYSYQSGDWDIANSWTTDASGNTRQNSRVPGPLDNVIILNGRTISISANTKQVNSLAMNSGGILDIASTTGHNFGTVTGQGKILLSSNTFPGGSYTNFVASGGGTIEYYNLNNTSISTTQLTYNNLIISNKSAGINSAYLNNGTNPTNYVINGNFSLKNYSTGSHTFSFGNSTASDNLINMTVYGDFTVDAGCNVRVNNFATSHAIPDPANNTTAYPVHTLSLYGNLTNNGSIRFTGLPSPVANAYYLLGVTASGGINYGDVQVFFYGATNNTVTCNGITDFYRLIVAKGIDKTYTLEVSSSNTNNFALYASNDQGTNNFNGGPEGFGYGAYYKALFIHYGTLKLNENISIPSLTEGGQDFNVIPTAELWINGANVSTTLTGVNGTGYQAATLYGTLRISGGQFSTGDAAGLVLGTLGTPVIQIEGTGVLDASQTWTATGGSNQMSYIQTGGTANFRLQGEQQAGPMLGLSNINSSFTMSGGIINFTNNTFVNAATDFQVLDIQSQVGNYNVTGGTVNLNLPSSATVYTANSTVPFYNLNISRGSGALTTIVQWNTGLTVLHDLTIGGNSTLDLNTNALDLTVGHDFTVSALGTYTPAAGKTTIFNGTGAQTFTNTGTITGNLRNLTLTNTADVTFAGSNNTITGNLTIGHGTILRDNATTIFVQGNITNSGTHFNPGTGSIQLTGAAAQIISGDGTDSFNNLTLNKTGGSVTITADITVTGNLRLAGAAGVWNIFNIGSNRLSLGTTAMVYSDMTTGTAFNNNRMIQTSGMFSDDGVSKIYSSTTAFVFPLGFYNTANTTYYYMPHSVQFGSAPTAYGTVTTRAVNARHPLAQGATNALTCYWKTTSTGFTGVPAGSVVNNYYYDYALSKHFVSGTETNYIPGVYYNSLWNTINNVALVNEAANQVTYNADNADGEYTAGDPAAFGSIPTLYSAINGPWNNASTWSATRGGAGGAGIPGGTTLVIICNGYTVTTPAAASSSSLTIETGSTLDLGGVNGHNFGSIPICNGALRIASTNYFPTGDWSNFLGTSGGTVEYYQTSAGTLIVPTAYNLPAGGSGTITSYYNLITSPYNGSNVVLPNANVTIYNNYTVGYSAGGGTSNCTTQMNAGAGSTTLEVKGNININQYGVLQYMNNLAENLIADNDINIESGGALQVANSGGTVANTLTVYGNIVNNGTIDLDPNATSGTYYCILNFTGSLSKSLTSTVAPTRTRLYNIGVNKGTSRDSVLDVNVNSTGFQMGNGGLNLQNGTFKLTTNVTMPLSAGGFTIPGSACLSANGGTFNIATGAAAADLSLVGRLELLAGTVNVGPSIASASANAFNIVYASAGTPEIIVSGGSLNVYSQIRRGTGNSSGSLNYTQSGGTVTIGGKNSSASRAVFEVVNGGSKFTMSNGSIILASHITAATPYDLYLNPDVENVTGGTIQFGLSGVTPASTLFYFQSSCSIGNIILEATTNSSAIQEVFPLTLVGSLTIGGSSSYYNTNGLDVTIAGNLTNNNTSQQVGLNVGGYRTQVITQSTGFNGSTDQSITGTNSNNLTNFADLDVSTAAGHTLFLSNGWIVGNYANITVNGDLTLTSGTLDDGGNPINLLNNVNNNAAHVSPNPTTGGMIFNGSIIQGITGSGSGAFGHIEINNSGHGVTMTDNSTINGQLKFTNGYIYIDNYSLTFGQSGSITGADGTNHIILNGVSGDIGVTKIFPASFTSSFTFPIGDNGKYTPCTYNFISSTNAQGATINVVPIDDLHPTINPASYTNYLNYYWKVIETGFTPSTYTVMHSYTYIPADITGSPSNIQRCDNSTSAWSTVPPGTISSPTFSFNSTTLLDGSYTIGDVFGSLPTANSIKSGNWNDPTVWSIGSVPNGNAVVINSGHTVTLSADGVVATSVDIEGVLDATNTVSHNIGTVSGTGKIRLSPTASAMFAFPGGSYDAFLANSTSTVEFYGNTDGTMPLNPGNINKPYQQVIFSGTGKKYISSVDTKINGNLTISDGSKLDNTLYNKDLFVLGNWIDNNTSTAGFTAGSGSVRFNGTTAQNIIMASNTMKETFYNLETNNAAGLTISTGTVDVSNQLMLTLGNINFANINNNILTITNTNTNAIAGGGTISFVNGPLSKKIINGSSFQFPVGDANSSSRNRIGYVSVTNTATAGTQTWTARFFDKNPTADGYDITKVTLPLSSVVQNEYWNIIGPAGGSAKVVLSWDQYTGMSSSAAKRALSKVSEWNTPVATSWNSDDGTVTDGGQNLGTVATPALVNLDNHLFTIGAISASLITATQSGLWNNSSTWGGVGVPGLNDTVEITNSVTVTLNANAAIAKLLVDNGGILDNGNNTLTLSGNLYLNGTLTGSGGTISMTTSPDTIFGSGVTTGICTLEVAGNKVIDVSASPTFKTVSILNNLTLTNNGTVTIDDLLGSANSTFVNASGSTLVINGQLLTTGILSAAICTNTVIYNGTVAQTIKPVNYCNLTLNSSGAKTINDGAAITVNGDVTQQSDTPFSIGTTTGTVTIQIIGSLITGNGFVNYGDITVGN